MGKLLRDLWVVMVLAFGQLLITYVYLGFVPYAYLVHASRSDEQVRQNLEDLDSYVSTHPDSQVSAPQLFEERPELVAGLVSAIPWALIVLLGSCLIFPFLGWWAGRLLHYPQGGGLAVLASIITQQNIVFIPKNIEYWNVAPVALGLPAVMLVIMFQFTLLTAGIYAQKRWSPTTPSEGQSP